MGLIFDINSAGLYDSWCRSPQGKKMEQSAERLILTLLDPQPGERVLDIGCGAGNHLLSFNRLGLDISGIDASPYMLSRAKERLGSHVSLKKGMAEDLPFDDNEFDLAVLINTMEFLDDPIQALREAGRVAKRKVFVGVMNSLSWHYMCVKLQGLFRSSLFYQGRFYNLWQLKSYVRAAYGPVPMAWGCEHFLPQFIGKIDRLKTDSWDWNHCPFGSFLGLSAAMLYWVKTENLPLKIRMGKTRQSIAGGLTVKNIHHREGIEGDERGLSV